MEWPERRTSFTKEYLLILVRKGINESSKKSFLLSGIRSMRDFRHKNLLVNETVSYVCDCCSCSIFYPTRSIPICNLSASNSCATMSKNNR